MNSFFSRVIKPGTALAIEKRAKRLVTVIPAIMFAVLFVATPEQALAGTSAMFDAVGTDTQAAVFGPLGQAVIYIAALGGGIFAVMKGAWMFAGLGIGVAGLMFLSQTVAGASTFSALLPVTGIL